ncbi:hypothetical protein LB505_013190 [Fusarium chuoi]|nr:hypothetical protein LB505_013190 [Fusarium chuoi]
MAGWLVFLCRPSPCSLRYLFNWNGHLHVRGGPKSLSSSSSRHGWYHLYQYVCRSHLPCSIGICSPRHSGTSRHSFWSTRTDHYQECCRISWRNFCSSGPSHHIGDNLWHRLHNRHFSMYLCVCPRWCYSQVVLVDQNKHQIRQCSY